MNNLEKYRLYLKNLNHNQAILDELKDKKITEHFSEWNLKYKLKLNKYFSKYLNEEFSINLSYKSDRLFLYYNSNVILGVSFLHKAKNLGDKIIYDKIQIETPKIISDNVDSHKQYLVINDFVKTIIKNESKLLKLFNGMLQKQKIDFTKKIEKPILKHDNLGWKYFDLLEKLVTKKLFLYLKKGEINFEQLYSRPIFNFKFDPFGIELYQVKFIKYLKKENKLLILGRNAKDDYDTTLPYQIYEFQFQNNEFKDNLKEFLFLIFDKSLRYYDHENLFLNE